MSTTPLEIGLAPYAGRHIRGGGGWLGTLMWLCSAQPNYGRRSHSPCGDLEGAEEATLARDMGGLRQLGVLPLREGVSLCPFRAAQLPVPPWVPQPPPRGS